jgi:membrane protein
MTEALENYIKQLEQWMWHSEANTKTKTGKFLFHSARILFAVLRDIFQGHITLHAMSLVYTTLLSIIPFLALSFSVLKAFGVHDQLEPLLITWLEPLGTRGPEVIDNVLGLIDNMKVGLLGSVGLGLLIYWVISLVQKVERSFNEVWKVNKSRSFAQRFSNYLSVIIIGPVLIVSAMGATTVVVGSDFFKQLVEIAPLGWLYSLFTRIMPYIIVIALFTFLYIFIPNTKVKVRSALAGAIVAGIMWQSAIFGFAMFVANSTRYSNIYSGFAVGILLLIWMYVSWLILLVGASVSFYTQHAKQITKRRVHRSSAVLDEYTGLAIVHYVAKRFDTSGGGVTVSDMEADIAVEPETSHRIIEKLIKHHILTYTGDNDRLLPARSLDKILLSDLIRTVRSPEGSLPTFLTTNATITQIVDSVEEQINQVADNRTIADWIRA